MSAAARRLTDATLRDCGPDNVQIPPEPSESLYNSPDFRVGGDFMGVCVCERDREI